MKKVIERHLTNGLLLIHIGSKAATWEFSGRIEFEDISRMISALMEVRKCLKSKTE